MLQPYLSGKTRVIKTLEAFGGYNRNLRIADGEFSEMRNMTSDHFPILSPRSRRGKPLPAENCTGLLARESLCWVSGSQFYVNGYGVELGLSEEPKELVSMGAYVIILPDRVYINTEDLTDHGKIEAFFSTVNPTAFSLCFADGTDATPHFTQTDAPAEPENRQLWLDISGQTPELKQWSSLSGIWVSIPTTYVKIASPGIGRAFSEFDGIFLRGLTGTVTDALTGTPLENSSDLAALEGSHVIWCKGDDFIVVTGILTQSRTVENTLTLSREMPRMDFVIERENRLWGCRYGPDRQGRVVNEIYASKLGDFKNWYCFMGLSTDSYTVSVGSDGPFTGAVNYAGYPLFWKENCVHKLFGDIPANFGIQTTPCRGVQKGSEKSLAMVGEILYYKAEEGVCAYDGSLPAEVSTQLGRVRYARAVAGATAGKYYISMEDEEGTGHLFVYDTRYQLWHKEDDLRPERFCSWDGTLYCLSKGLILPLTPADADGEETVSWMVTTGRFSGEGARRIHPGRLVLRLSMAPGAGMRAYIRYDGLGQWEFMGSVRADSTHSFAFPIRPRRCDHFQLRLEGEGQVRIYSLTQITSQGSERI